VKIHFVYLKYHCSKTRTLH